MYTPISLTTICKHNDSLSAYYVTIVYTCTSSRNEPIRRIRANGMEFIDDKGSGLCTHQ